MKISARYALTLLGIVIPLAFGTHILLSMSVRSLTDNNLAHLASSTSLRISSSLAERTRVTQDIVEALALSDIKKTQPLLTQPQLEALHLDLVILFDSLGTKLWSVRNDPSIESDPFPSDSVRKLLNLSMESDATSGLFQFGQSPSIAVVRTVRYSSEADGGTLVGRLLAIRLIDQNERATLSHMTGADITIRRSISSSSSQTEQPSNQSEVPFHIDHGNLVRQEIVRGVLPSEYFEIAFSTPSTYETLVAEIKSRMMILLLFCVLAITFAASRTLERVVLRRVSSITKQLRGLITRPELKVSVKSDPTDEFGMLGDEVNKTLSGYFRSQQTAARATRMAQVAIDAKTDFIASISHEVRSPLNAILGVAQILERMSLPMHLREYIHIVKESGNTLLELINDVLDFSTIEAGKLTFQRSPFDIQELLTNVVVSNALPAFQKNVEVIIHITANAPTHIEGDRIRVKQILSTLINNAVQFTDVAEIVVSLDASSSTKEECKRVLVSIKDSGIGIPPEKEASIFETFTRGEGPSQKRLGRTGLGLPIARGLARGMGGDIWVENHYGHGATFFLELVTPAVSMKGDMECDIPPDTEILIADCHPLSAKVVRRILSDFNLMRVIEVNQQALADRLEDAVSRRLMAIIDARLINDQLLEQLRGLSQNPLVTWLVLVPPHLSPQTDQYILAGARNAIPKPISRATFAQYLFNPALPSEPNPSTTVMPTPKLPRSDAGAAILVVDDVESNRFILENMLRGWGHTVVTASSGIEAVNKLRDSGHFDTREEPKLFDLVLMDVQMPQVNGIEATRIIRASEQVGNRQHTVPIIAVTADAQVKDIDEYVYAGMWGAITKPINAVRLYGMIQSLGLRNERISTDSSAADRMSPDDTDLIAFLERKDLRLSVSRLWNDLGRDMPQLMDILHSFVEQTMAQMSALTELVGNGQCAPIAEAAHALKGSLLNCGVLGCAQVASDLEDSARANNIDGAKEHTALLNEKIAVVLDLLRTAIARYKESGREAPVQ